MTGSREATLEHFTRPELGGVRLARHCWGSPDAPPLVLLHGAGANSHWWDHLAVPLSARFHVVALDFRGHGDSDFPEERPAGAFATDLESLLAEIDAPDAILVGHSLGAHVALDHAASGAPTRALALLDLTRGASPSRKRATKLALTLRRSYATREQAVERFRFLPGAAHADESLRRRIAARSVREEPDGRFGFKFDPHWFSVPGRRRSELSRVHCPTLLIRGGDSKLLTAEGARAIADEIPGCRLREIAGAGHHVHIDRPAEVLAALEEFLPHG